jgi:predicted nuclease with TOPRIM domain
MRSVKEKKMKSSKDLQKEIAETKKLIKSLRKQNAKLKDEVESLWGMLDELNQADIKNWAHLMKDLEEKDAIQQLVTAKKADC